MQLYKLADEYMESVRAIEQMLDSGDIDQGAAENTLEGLGGEIKDKAINVALHIKNLRSDIEQLEAAKASFDARIRQAKASLEFYENYLDRNLVKAGIKEIKSDLVVVKYRALPAIVTILGDVPAKYQRVIPETREPDKKAIMAALKAGQSFDFVSP